MYESYSQISGVPITAVRLPYVDADVFIKSKQESQRDCSYSAPFMGDENLPGFVTWDGKQNLEVTQCRNRYLVIPDDSPSVAFPDRRIASSSERILY